MDEATQKPDAQKSQEETRKEAIKAYQDAETKQAKAAVVKKYPFLSQIFSASNHS